MRNSAVADRLPTCSFRFYLELVHGWLVWGQAGDLPLLQTDWQFRQGSAANAPGPVVPWARGVSRLWQPCPTEGIFAFWSEIAMRLSFWPWLRGVSVKTFRTHSAFKGAFATGG